MTAGGSLNLEGDPFHLSVKGLGRLIQDWQWPARVSRPVHVEHARFVIYAILQFFFSFLYLTKTSKHPELLRSMQLAVTTDLIEGMF